MRRLLLVPLLFAGACAAPQAQLTPDVLSRMQREARIEIYDRENDLAIALGKGDDVRLRDAELRRQLDGIDDLGKRIKARLTKPAAAPVVAKEGSAPKAPPAPPAIPASPERIAKLDTTLDARRDHVRAQIRLNQDTAAVAETQVALAHSRLEQTRQRQLVRTGRALQTSLEPFDQRVKQLEQRLKDAEKREQDDRIEAEKAFDAWKGAEDAYARATGDFDTGIWID